MRVKICGLHPLRDVKLCIDLGVNYLGFVFYKKSPRNLNLNDIQRLKSYNKIFSYMVQSQMRELRKLELKELR